MAYTYKSITNEILRSLNEVELDSDGEFSNAVDFYAYVKDAVNIVIQDICNAKLNSWPFQRQEGSQVLTVGAINYQFASNVSAVDFDSFYIDRDNTLNSPDAKNLCYLPWELYKDKVRIDDLNTTSTDDFSKPDYVIHNQFDTVNGFSVSGVPDEAYTVKFKQVVIPEDLVQPDDVPIIPQHYKQVIKRGVRALVFGFREDAEEEAKEQNRYEKLIDSMGMNLIELNPSVYTEL